MKKILLAALAATIVPASAWANSTGIPGYSGSTNLTCNTCHKSSGQQPQATISGPTFLKPGATGTYTFLLTSYAFLATYAGLDLSANSGTLSVNSGETSWTKKVGSELTHSTPKPPSSIFLNVSWKFDWTAPSAAGTYVLFGAGLAANGDKTFQGDRTGSTLYAVAVGTCQSNSDCSDSNPCTTDICDATTKQCTNTKIPGCCLTDTDCDDNNACTKETCTPGSHQCIYAIIPSCCTADSQCTDGNLCTKDTCDLATNTCSFSAITNCCITNSQCTDGNACTLDSCDMTLHQCIFYPIPNCCKTDADCKDNSVCTSDSCNVATGICLNSKVPNCCTGAGDCDDKDICTKDACTNNVCTFTKVPGCCKTAQDCNDGNPCTTDTCSSNQCVYTAIPNCVPPDAGPPPDGAVYKDKGPVKPDGQPKGDGPAAGDLPVTSGDGKPTDGLVSSGDGGPGTPDTGGQNLTPSEDDGCCRVSHARQATSWPLLALLGAFLLLALRRRRG